MKQILQNLNSGKIQLAEIPVPKVRDGHILIRTEASLISKGTEKMLLEFGKSGWIARAKQQPDKVKQVIDKVKSDGIVSTIQTVRNKLDDPLPLGYCNAGEIIGIGKDVTNFEIGDRVASNGYHAEYVLVPQNLCAKVDKNISSEEASFTVLGSIALQGIRLLDPKIGEIVAVVGLGLVGLLSVQILRANGCKVIGIDFDKKKLELAKDFGIETVNLSEGESSLEKTTYITNNNGVDGVVITASSSNNDIIHSSAQMCRKRGRIVLVGVVGLDLQRSDFYEKELSFQVSCSYGPGRYDDNYELKGNDYPIGFVRWTEQRNFQAILQLMGESKIDVKSLISHRYKISDANSAYDKVLNDPSSLGIILNYGGNKKIDKIDNIKLENEVSPKIDLNKIEIGLIGAGSYVSSTLLPNLKEIDCDLHSIVSTNGIKASHLGRKYHFQEISTNPESIINNPQVDALIVATQHDSHSDFVIKAIKANKPIFIEKPLAINPTQLNEILEVYKNSEKPIIMVGFNRRFAPLIKKMKKLSDSIAGEKTYIFTVNAGNIPTDHWVQDIDRGGGRIIGEVCHFIDLVKYFANSKIVNVQSMINGKRNKPIYSDDNISISIKFDNGSHAVIHYLSTGDKKFPKERFEIIGGNKILQLDNFRTLNGYGWSGFSKKRTIKQIKGHKECLSEFIDAVKFGKSSPINFMDAVEVTKVTFDILDLL